MAQYNVRFGCGHSDTVVLYGPDKERFRRIEYLEEHGLCPDCYKAKKRAEEEAAGPQFYARRTAEGVEFVCWSGSYQIKDQLKQHGYRFGDVYPPTTGAVALAGALQRPRKGWSLTIKAEGEELKARGTAEGQWIKDHGWTLEVLPVPMSMLASVVEGREDLLPPR